MFNKNKIQTKHHTSKKEGKMFNTGNKQAVQEAKSRLAPSNKFTNHTKNN